MGIQYLAIEGYSPTTKFYDYPANVWNTLAEFYAKYNVGIEVRYTMPVEGHPLPGVFESKTAMFVVKKVVHPKRTGTERRKMASETKETENETGAADVVSISGDFYDVVSKEKDPRVLTDLVMVWQPQLLVWRCEKRMEPYLPEELPVFMEAIPGNVKLTTQLKIEDIVSGIVPVHPLFEYDRPDAPKSENKRVQVLPLHGFSMVQVGDQQVMPANK
jgi:hypothetical protein